MTIGNVSNYNYIPAAGRVNSPLMKNTKPAGPAVASTAAAAYRPQTQGTNALFFSPDGDRAEISGRARGMQNIPVLVPSFFPYTSVPISDSTEDPAGPEMTGNRALEALDPQGACETCKNRKYVDQSDDASVSFQTPTSISPSMAGAAVAAHEQEHVRNEQARAQRDGREIVNQSVTLTYATCPECGKHYVSGGTTRTTSVSKSDSEESEEAPEIGASSGGESPDDE